MTLVAITVLGSCVWQPILADPDALVLEGGVKGHALAGPYKNLYTEERDRCRINCSSGSEARGMTFGDSLLSRGG